MKSLCLLAISVMIFGFSSTVNGQTMKERLQAQKDKLTSQKKGRVCAPDLTEEQVVEFLGGSEPDDGIISPFHQANIGKVVFTKKKIAPKDITAADVVTEFSINDPIYFTFFMDKSFRNQVMYPLNQDGRGGFNESWCWDYSFKKFYEESNGTGIPQLNIGGKSMIYVEMDGKQVEEVPFYLPVNSNSTETAFTGVIASNPSDIVPRPEWMDFMRKLAEGNHTFKVEIASFSLDAGMTKGLAASGGFTLKKKAGESYTPVMGKSWSDYTAKMKDANLTAKALTSVRDFGRDHSYSEEFIKVKIESRDWVITRTKTLNPVITGRYIVALCYTTWPDGMCKVQRYLFRQNYTGSGYSSTLLCRGVYNNDYPQAIDCD